MSQTYYESLSQPELAAELAALEDQVAAIKARGLKLNMARGKPSAQQLDLSRPLLAELGPDDELVDGGVDCLNYGCLEGIPSARAFFGDLMGVPAGQVLVGGESSLTLMYDALCHAMVHGVLGGEPFATQRLAAPLKWVCLTPGYDRHFGIVEQFGFELVSLPLGEHGPDMDQVRDLVEKDPRVKGMWCVPKYSNPSGVTYSDDVVRAIAALRPAAPDFRVYWDNAYLVHDLYPQDRDELLNVFDAVAQQGGDPDLVYEFCSTSKITFPGAGVSAMAASEANLKDLLAEYRHRMIGHDKINQLRHVRFLRDQDGLRAHMELQADVLRPRFELVQRRLEEGLGGLGVASWTKPRGGYFVSFDGRPGTARATVALCAECGVTLTGAGATWPHGVDPLDANIRIAPSYPSLEELDAALEVFVACVKLAAARQADRGGRA